MTGRARGSPMDGDFLIFLGSFFGLGIALVPLTLLAARHSDPAATPPPSRQRSIDEARRAPRTTIAAAPVGTTVTLVGRARLLRRTVTAPLSERRCGYFVMDSFVTGSGYGEFQPARPAVYEARGCPFVLDDGTGLARVRVDDAVVAAPLGPASDEAIRAFCERRQMKPSDEWTLHEWAVGEGDPIVVVGVVRDQPLGASVATTTGASYRERPREVVVSAPPGLCLVLDDAPSGG